jgi:hypothetical protein
LGRRARPVKRVVFTCLFGYSEPFAGGQYVKDGMTDFICFTDDTSLRSDTWTFQHVDTTLLGPVRTAKMVKILAHEFLPAYESSIYLDNTVRMVAPYAETFARLERSANPMIIFRHPWRSCVYDEAEAVKIGGYDDPSIVDAQMKHYRSIGHPENAGLSAGGFQARRHNDPVLVSIMTQWFLQVCLHSYRDQLSFNVVARQLGFEPDYFPGSQTDSQTIVWPTIPAEKRLPRDFHDEIYLKLHDDVRRAGANPRQHYLSHGMKEGRAYKHTTDA